METRTTLCGSLLAIVVLAFFMPFFELRCAGDAASVATGYELAVGQLGGAVEPSGPQVRQPWLLALPLLAAAGAAAAFLALRARPERARRLLRGAAAAGAAAVALAVASHLRLQQQVPGLLRARAGQGDLTAEAALSISVRPRMGWYVALLAAAAAVFLARSVRPKVQDAAPPADLPPPATQSPSGREEPPAPSGT